MICSKLARMFLCETMTPAGVRVDPDVYCKYAVSVELSSSAAGRFLRVEIQQINLDDRWSGFAGLRLDILGDVACDRGCRENGSGRCVAQHRTNTFIAGAT